MRLSMRVRRAVLNVTAKRYQKATKKDRGRILDEFTHVTDYGRKYAAWLLTNWHRRRVLTVGGVRTVFVFGLKKVRKGLVRPKRPPTYGPETVRHLKQLWALAGGLCGKRLAPFIRETLPVLERFEEVTLSVEVRAKLLAVSPATIDRLLAPERKKYQLKGRSTTRPGSLLKHQIPIRTFADWDERRPGFVEVDLVAHDGGFPGPEVIHSLTLTDVATGWTEIRPLKTRARRWVLEALVDITRGLPFPLRGLDCDNGSEFINVELTAYCTQHHLTFTRSRPYRKNDSCFVEQKNYTIVRQAIGYLRLHTEEQLHCLRALHGPLGLFTNHFLPSLKLVKKTRSGSKVIKLYDQPMTPFQRLITHPDTDKASRVRLLRQHHLLNPAQLRRDITACQRQLEELTENSQIQKHRKQRTVLDSILR